MKRFICLASIFLLSFSCLVFAQNAKTTTITITTNTNANATDSSQAVAVTTTAPVVVSSPAATTVPVVTPIVVKPKIILLISEQNIEGPQRAWWASEIDLSTVEMSLASKLLQSGYEVLEPSVLNKVIKKDSAFKQVSLKDSDSIELAKLAGVDYVVLGKAIASAGGNIPQSNMRSAFANVTAKLIKVADGKVIAYLDASGNSAHMDVITGGREALTKAGSDLAIKIVNALSSGN